MERYNPIRIEEKWQKRWKEENVSEVYPSGFNNNALDPLGIIDAGYGVDTLRVYEMFVGPAELNAAWDPCSVGGVYHFLSRCYNLAFDERKEAAKDNNIVLRNKTIKHVTEAIRRHSFNTAIAFLMKYVKELYKVGAETADLETLAKLLKPFAPHLACEILEKLGIKDDELPVWDERYPVDNVVEIMVQVNGKLRAKIHATREDLEDEEKIKALALADEKVKQLVVGKPKRVVFVKWAKLINFVV